MRLRDCTHGKLVISGDGKIGMIVGITNNVDTADYGTRSQVEHAIPLVQWSCGRTTGIHQGNIEPYTGSL